MSGLSDVDWEAMYRAQLFINESRRQAEDLQWRAVKTLGEALQQYGTHSLNCKSTVARPCDCGLDMRLRHANRLLAGLDQYTREMRNAARRERRRSQK